MRKIYSFVVATLLMLLPLFAFAHSGRTDSIGGHYNNTTGKYHFHHGKSAHQHENGRCPYDNSGRTDWPTAKPDRNTQTPRPYVYSFTGRSASATIKPTSIPTSAPRQEKDGSGDSSLRSAGYAFAGAAAGGFGVSLLRRKNRG